MQMFHQVIVRDYNTCRIVEMAEVLTLMEAQAWAKQFKHEYPRDGGYTVKQQIVKRDKQGNLTLFITID